MKPRSILLTLLVLLGFCGPPAHAGLVTYHSTSGTAAGYVIDPYNGYEYFDGVPASLRISYNYDPTIPGGFSNLVIFASAGHYYNATVGEPDQPGTIRWSGDTITFHAVEPTPGFPSSPTFVVDVSFKGSPLVPGVIPDSLAGLEGVTGTFHATAQASIYYRGSTADVFGTVVSAPEPSSVVLLTLGAVGIGVLSRGHRKSRCTAGSRRS